MAHHALFIGINKYAAADIRNLTAAVRDATAIHALFLDTMPDLSAQLLVDDAATIDNVRAALHKVLVAAKTEDTVVVFFSGHGTHDNRLVVHDTDRTVLPTTTLSMDELAKLFKESAAHAILCIVDCCFSGGAPGRVLEDSPIARDSSSSIDSLAGAGRIIISACRHDEQAYEMPNSHGLLTGALLDTLQAATGPVDLMAAISSVMNVVRASASKMGYEQVPVLFGYVEGGLVLPPLRAGKNYALAFPDLSKAVVTERIADLSVFGIPQNVLSAWEARFNGGLNGLQLRAVNELRVLDGNSLFVVAPTSAGKTFIGELAALRAIVEGRRSVFLLPYKALVNEKYDEFTRVYGEQVGMRVIRCSGDFGDQIDEFLRGKYEFAFLTYEMFLNLVVTRSSLLNQVGLVVLDEAQFITDPGRGINVELILTSLLTARQRGVAPQLVTLSAVIGHVNSFDEWLGCELLITDKRPVPLIEGVIDRSGVYQYKDHTGQPQRESFISPNEIQIRRAKPSSQDVIVPLVKRLVGDGEKVIIFRNQRGAAEGCATYLARELGLPAADERIEDLPSHDLSSTATKLSECLKGGTAFHNSNLTREQKELVERAFRTDDSKVRVLVATSTVAAGINTPASTVIIVETEFPGEDPRPYTVAEYKNMSGRAGRLGIRPEGRSILIADSLAEQGQLFRNYVMGTPERVRSSFTSADLSTWALRLLSQVESIERRDTVGLLANTYGGFLAGKVDPRWHSNTVTAIEASVDSMVRLALLSENVGRISLTALGRACGQSALKFDSAISLIELIRRVPATTMTAERVMALIQVLPEIDRVYVPMMRRGAGETGWRNEVGTSYGTDIVALLGRGARDTHVYNSRCKKASLLWDWIHGMSIEQLERKYTVNPFNAVVYGDITGLADTARYYLQSAFEIVSLIFNNGGPDSSSFGRLLQQLEAGLPETAVDLLAIPGLNRGERLALAAAGLSTVESVVDCDQSTLEGILGTLKTRQVKLMHRPSPLCQYL